MAGVIDEDGTQWEHCMGCTKFVKIQDLMWSPVTEKFPYGRDLCPRCFGHVRRHGPDVAIKPDPKEVEARARVREQMELEMRGKQYAFGPTIDLGNGVSTTEVRIVDVN